MRFIYNGDTWPNPMERRQQRRWCICCSYQLRELADFFFVEDNYLEAFAGMNPTSGTDDLRGGRWVLRHNHMYERRKCKVTARKMVVGAVAGREKFTTTIFTATANAPAVGGIRSGVTVFHDNTVDGSAPGRSRLSAYRLTARCSNGPACPFAGATGDNPLGRE